MKIRRLVAALAASVVFSAVPVAHAQTTNTEYVVTDCSMGDENYINLAFAYNYKTITYAVPCTVVLTKPMRLGSGVTIRGGRNSAPTFTGNGAPISGFVLDHVNGVTLHNLKITSFGDITGRSGNAPHDCIGLLRATSVRLSDLTISFCADKQVSVLDQSTADITQVHFLGDRYHAQFLQIGAQAFASQDHVRLWRNWFDGNGYREPNTSYGTSHSWNNLFDRPPFRSQCHRNAQCLFENDIWVARQFGDPMIDYQPSGDGCNDAGNLCDTNPGYGRVTGAWLLNGAQAPSNHPDRVFYPTYTYALVPADQALMDSIKAAAGAS